MITNKKILITGQQGLAAAVRQQLLTNNTVTTVGKSNGHDINKIQTWGSKYLNHDVVINCAYDEWGQVAVLEFFANAWQHQPDRQIINIGSKICTYTRTERNKDHEYWPYRLHKIALTLAFSSMCDRVMCDMKLINPGPIESTMTQHLNCKKMPVQQMAAEIIDIMNRPCIKRVDLWL